jgi:hypothetical protein
MTLNRIYYPQQNSRAKFLALGIKCVFISYQKKDREAAMKVADYLENSGISIYIDIYDSDLKLDGQVKAPQKVTSAICKGINNSSHMLVVVSANTVFSTWVPFEIGYGYEKTDLGILCLKGIPVGGLPEYARIGKIIRDVYDLDLLTETLSGKTKEKLNEVRLFSGYKKDDQGINSVMDSLIIDKY